jgi:formate dehydrogenase subunit gamma
MSQDKMIQRYNASERANHWGVALTFILAALSGLALFHPAFYWLTGLFGSGAWTRILHPFIGVVLFAFFIAMAARFWTDNRISDADRKWGKHIREILRNKPKNLPEIGKYNLGQKYLFWTLVTAIFLLLLSGIVIWQPWFAPAFPIVMLRVAVVVHALSAFVAILALIVHVYAAYWTRGSIRAMTRGTVTAAWARHHHPGWFKEVADKDR